MKWTRLFLLPAWGLSLAFTPNYTLAQSGYAVVERGPDYTVLQKTTVENGTNRVHKIVTIATGLNFTNSYGQLVPAQEQITILPQGGAVANQGRHQVYFPPDIGSGVLKVTTPSGQILQSRPLCVTIDDGNNIAVIGVLTNSVGWLTASNQVTYKNCFCGDIKGDLVVNYRRSGVECDLVFRSQPAAPSAYGLSDANSTIQLVTEFFNTADPQQIPTAYDDWFGLQDDTLRFGKMTMKQGKAFATQSANSQLPSANFQTPVYKSWLHAGGRTFLVEQVPLVYLADELDALPLTASAARPNSQLPSANSHSLASAIESLPATRASLPQTKQILVATAEMNREPGVVLDYTAIVDPVGPADFHFTSGFTYYITGNTYFWGEGSSCTLEGGSILKFAPWAGIEIYPGFSFVCATTPDNPAVLTAVDDDTVGEIIPGSTGHPEGNYYAYGAIGSEGPQAPIHDLRISYAWLALYWTTNIYNCQFLNDGQGILPIGDLTMGNILLKNVDTGFYFYGGANIAASFVTADHVNTLVSGVNLSLTNSLLVSVAGLGDGFTGDYNASSASDTGIFASAGWCGDYLAASSPYRNAGTTQVDPDALAAIQTMTTYAPQNGSYADTDTPDLGYHYPVGYPTSADSDNDGLPDWWELEYFGTLALNGTTLDTGGNTLLYDYQHDLVPENIINFTIRLKSQVNTTSATGSHQILAGDPYYEAVLVNSTNFSDAVWQLYDGNIYLTLGPTDGVYQVWVGLKGHAPEATPTWIGTEVTLNRQVPRITITSPTANVVAQPWLQLQGYATLPLAGITFDISNATAFVTNQSGNIIAHTIDTNLMCYTTDYFQCYDIPLAEGTNAIWLHATDPAGNVTNLVLNMKLDYSIASNPVINVAWPSNGVEIGGSSFTVRGWTEDSSASVTAQIVDAANNTNIASGLVERTGTFWARDLPLAAGTSTVTIWVTNAAGLSSETNFTVVKSDMTMTLTPSGDLWLPTVSVSGAISDPDADVWVNGVEGVNNHDGTWSAASVPVPAGGVASFDVQVVPAGGGDPWWSFIFAKADEVIMDSDIWGSDYAWQAGNDGNGNPTAYGTDHASGSYTFAGGGVCDEHEEYYVPSLGIANVYDWITELGPGGAVQDHYVYLNGVLYGWLDPEHPLGTPTDEVGALKVGPQDGKTSEGRHSKPHRTFVKEGWFPPGTQMLVAAGTSFSEELAKPTFVTLGNPVPFGEITISDMGPEGDNGMAYTVKAAGSAVEVTPTTDKPMATGGVGANAYLLSIIATVNGVNNDLSTTIPTFCVGQQVTFTPCWNGSPEPSFMPPYVGDSSYIWSLGGTFVNQPWQVTNYTTAGPIPVGSVNWRIDPDSLNWQQPYGYWTTGGSKNAYLHETLYFSNGQKVMISANGKFNIYRPTAHLKKIYSPFHYTISYDLALTCKLQLGDGSGVGAMHYEVEVDSQSPFDGVASITQLATADYSNPAYQCSNEEWDGNGINTPRVVGGIQPGIVGQDDGPHDVWTNPNIVSLSARDFVQFTPDGGIAVTLGIIHWETVGIAEQDVSGKWWSITEDATTDPDGPDNSNEFPSWTQSLP